MKKLTNIVLAFMLFVTTLATAQYGIGTTNPSPSAQLELNSTSKGFLMPRMTTLQRDGITSPATGLMVYNLSSNKLNYFNGTIWLEITGPAAPVSSVPDAPTTVLATVGNGTASVAFTAPTNDGGAPITNYIVTSTPGNFTGQGTASPITVTGLSNGTAYTFTVVAVNSLGSSIASAPSTAASPSTVPNAPTSVVATAGDASASVAFSAPADNGGAAITGYIVTSSPGNFTGTGAASPIAISGLTNGEAYTFTVVATNANGNSVASSASASATPVPPAPGVVTKMAVRPGSGSVFVSWEAPTTGGAADSYVLQRITSFGSPNVWTNVITLPSTTLSHTVTGLQNGINGGGDNGAWDHRFRVKAINLGGESISPELNAIAVAGTIAMHDNFNQVPSSANWEIASFTHGGGNTFAGSTNPSKLYGNADGRWNVSSVSNTTTTTAQTILNIDRSTGTKEIQFTYYIDPNSTGNGWYSFFGLIGPNGSRWGGFVNNPGNQNMFFSSTTGMVGLGAASETGRNFQLGGVSESGPWGSVVVRIVLPSAGGMQIYGGPTLKASWTAAEIPASFNNLKFYVNGTSVGQQYIDNVTVINHQ
jgi:hypothetical protein